MFLGFSWEKKSVSYRFDIYDHSDVTRKLFVLILVDMNRRNQDLYQKSQTVYVQRSFLETVATDPVKIGCSWDFYGQKQISQLLTVLTLCDHSDVTKKLFVLILVHIN